MGCGASASSRHTRVIWDIENVSVPRGLAAFDCVRAIETWLEERGLWGGAVDGLVSCFYNPDNFPRQHRDGLDHAGVEQVSEPSVDAARPPAFCRHGCGGSTRLKRSDMRRLHSASCCSTRPPAASAQCQAAETGPPHAGIAARRPCPRR